jgi:DNA-binding response OmpR family regulator
MEKKKIVFIDGDNYLSRLYDKLLSAVGYDVITAVDGDRGWYLIKENLPAVVICELTLARKDGLFLLKDIKKGKNTKSIPVIILTNNSERESIKKCLLAGASAYLIKPHHTPTEVVDVIISNIKN